jgi:hypothetical protein
VDVEEGAAGLVRVALSTWKVPVEPTSKWIWVVAVPAGTVKVIVAVFHVVDAESVAPLNNPTLLHALLKQKTCGQTDIVPL